MTITLDGKTFPVRATMRAWKNFEDATGIKVAKIESDDVTKIPMLVYYFVQEGCAKQGMKFDMALDDFLSLVVLSDIEMLSKVVEASMKPKSEKKTTEQVSSVGMK